MIRRWIIRGLCIWTLLLCIGLWILCGIRYGYLWYESHNRELTLDAINGQIRINCYRDTHIRASWGYRIFRNDPSQFWPSLQEPRPDDAIHHFYYAGFSFYSSNGDPLWEVSIPGWFPTLLSAALLWFVWRKTRPTQLGQGFPVEVTPQDADNN